MKVQFNPVEYHSLHSMVGSGNGSSVRSRVGPDLRRRNEVEEEEALFVFRCTHFDWRTRRCGSYASRPFMCRDYPRALLDQPWPVLFDACGFRPIARNAEQMRTALRDQQIPEAEREKLEKKLYLR